MRRLLSTLALAGIAAAASAAVDGRFAAAIDQQVDALRHIESLEYVTYLYRYAYSTHDDLADRLAHRDAHLPYVINRWWMQAYQIPKVGTRFRYRSEYLFLPENPAGTPAEAIAARLAKVPDVIEVGDAQEVQIYDDNNQAISIYRSRQGQPTPRQVTHSRNRPPLLLQPFAILGYDQPPEVGLQYVRIDQLLDQKFLDAAIAKHVVRTEGDGDDMCAVIAQPVLANGNPADPRIDNDENARLFLGKVEGAAAPMIARITNTRGMVFDYATVHSVDGKTSAVLPKVGWSNFEIQAAESVKVGGDIPAATFQLDHEMAKSVVDVSTGMELDPDL